ncbi:tRNA (cytidine/uridine-2'-O-)-methyltransferase TrmJ [Iodidimonas muriae]|uniref:tRNA (Cytidine/uridine-2'-O-)-methyltransferase TrmJ n=1 Tax=Iodidimonas muriae TaxID=261467 RepID=A0ABQ2L6Z7_9PROT|nr:RNA methyltransferase [Iodidimonas muriae]GER06521.1 tRNA (cytidine/uridine-2'-O-)-methyltransferase TrmJ [Kordiimonadales bacterium JCM 17843]GGO05131.1 tRNA (cytidine/uridine-2'-O-)-methyltransferase TrmJ [Iodidimonas muriae]
MTDLAPVVILVRPQLGENIGKAARAMLNFGLTEMRLVAPRDGWPNPAAGPAASGADCVLDGARLYDTVADAIGDLGRVYAATVRPRDMVKPVVTPQQAVAEIHGLERRAGLMFGPERSGLDNEDVALADTVMTVPVNPDFSSLNLAQAVILAAYEWFKAKDDTKPRIDRRQEDPAPKAHYQGLYDQLEEALDKRGYFRSADRKPTQMRALKSLFQNASLTTQEIQTLRGVIKSLTWAERK